MIDERSKNNHHKKKQAPCSSRDLKNDTLLKNSLKKIGHKAPARAGACKFHPPHVQALPHQYEATEWALSRDKSYLALDPGLGKTIVAAMVANALDATIFYICPPFLAQNTENEFTKWCYNKKLYLLPDSMLIKPKTIEAFLEKLKETKGEVVLIIDEAHRFKNEKAKRTKVFLKTILPLFSKVIYMSGTPLPNSRPKEIWPILKNTVPKIFGHNFFLFGLKYCGGFKTEFGWDFSGFTNRKEFKHRITRTFMLRQKKEILNLPPKIEGILVVGDKEPPKEVKALESVILKKYSGEDLIEGKIKQIHGIDGEIHLATYLRLIGDYKVKFALPIIESILEETNENILIFGVHKDVIKKLQTSLQVWKPLVITGETPKNKRQEIIRTFQEDHDRRVFIGNIQACGVGFTLTKAKRVLFVEFSWVDGDNAQASDRPHRIGQTESVLVQYVVLKDSIDHKRIEVVLNKRRLSI